MNTAIINLADKGMIYEQINKYIMKYLFLIYEKMFKTMNIHFKVLKKYPF